MASLTTWLRRARANDDAWRTETRLADLSGFIAPRFASFADSYGSQSAGPNQAIQQTIALYACVSLLADTIGSLPLHLYARQADGRARVEYSDAYQTMLGRGYPGSLSRIIGMVPNSEMTAQELWTFVVGCSALWGNAYIEVIRGANGRPLELWPLKPDRMKVERDGDGLVYKYKPTADGKELIIPEVLHIRAFGTDGVMGISPISVARKRLAADAAQTEFSKAFYENGARPAGVFTMPPSPNNDKDKYQERVRLYREGLEAHYGGATNAGRIMVIQNGAEWQSLNVPQSDMQFIETLHWTVEEWARLYRIPGFMIGRTEPGEVSYASVEQRNLHFLTYTLRPILARIENAICRGLGLEPGIRTLEDETPGLYAEFMTADLLRTDLKTRYEAYQIGVQGRWLSPSLVAQIENLPYDEQRPSEFENPNTTAPDAKPAQDPAAAQAQQEQNAALVALAAAAASRLAEPPQQLSFPDITLNPAPVNVYNKDVAGEMREALGTIPTPQVNVDLAPVAKMQGEIAAHSIMDAEQRDRREGERHAEVMAALEALRPPKPTRMVRKVTRNRTTGLIELVEDIPADEEAV